MVNHGTGWVRMEYLVPARGLIGFRTEFLTETRGTGTHAPRLRGLRALGRRAAHPARPARWSPTGPAGHRVRAVQPAGARHACSSARRSSVYEGMIVGENARSDDMDVNADHGKRSSPMSASSTGEELERLVPPRLLSLEQALEFCRTEECLEVTPDAGSDPEGSAFRIRTRAAEPVPSRLSAATAKTFLRLACLRHRRGCRLESPC